MFVIDTGKISLNLVGHSTAAAITVKEEEKEQFVDDSHESIKTEKPNFDNNLAESIWQN